jgi:hypothetical protein
MAESSNLVGEIGPEAFSVIERLTVENAWLCAALFELRDRLLSAGDRCHALGIEPGMGELINDMIDRIETVTTITTLC